MISSIYQISNQSLAWQTALASWGNDTAGLFPIFAASTALLDNINHGFYVAEASANLSYPETGALIEPTNILAAEVQSVLAAVTGKKGKFAAFGLVGFVKATLETLATGMHCFSLRWRFRLRLACIVLK
jgi:hypothetical protein